MPSPSRLQHALVAHGSSLRNFAVASVALESNFGVFDSSSLRLETICSEWNLEVLTGVKKLHMDADRSPPSNVEDPMQRSSWAILFGRTQ